MYVAISNESTSRDAATTWINSRRPPAIRSIIGPINGAMTRNGAKLITRNSSTLLRASPGAMLKNNESASATIIAASPPIIAACVVASRRNFEGGGVTRDRPDCAPAGRCIPPMLRTGAQAGRERLSAEPAESTEAFGSQDG